MTSTIENGCSKEAQYKTLCDQTNSAVVALGLNASTNKGSHNILI